MTNLFPKLTSPIRLGRHILRNRIIFGAHTTNMAEAGLPGTRHVAYYEERARGGAAMIVVEPMPVHKAAVLTRGNFRAGDDSVIAPFRLVTEAIHRHGALAVQQLYHIGAHGDSDNSFHPHWSPSGLPSWHDSDGSHEMSEAEIEETIAAFVAAARRCKESGFDGVEVWAAYHGLIDQFWTPWSNKREDQWGGSLENRTRISREIMSRIRAECGPDFIIGLSLSDEPDHAVMLSRDDLAEIVVLHEALGLVDYVTCGSGGYLDFYKLMPTFLYPEKLGADLAATLKRSVKSALVTAESHIRTPHNGESVLGEGAADLVSIVRGQIADPFLAQKAMASKPDDIRGCLSCNQMCWGRRSRDYWISCLINPSAGREFEWGGDRFTRHADPKRVLVVGGGPAGLEAARAAAECGHMVILAEASDRLGGQFRLAGLQPRRAQILDLLDWYERQLGERGVDVRLNTYLDGDDIEAMKIDRVILATGSLPVETGFQKAMPGRDHLPGIDLGHVHSAEAIMGRQARPGKSVIVFDEAGGWKAIGTAWKLAEAGHAVTIVSPDAMIGKELVRVAADFPARQVLARLGVHFVVESGMEEWHGNGLTIRHYLDGKTSHLPADDLVLVTTPMANTDPHRALLQKNIDHVVIGDAAAPRQAAYAFYEGRKAALEI